MAGRTLERPQQGAILSPGSIDALRASGVQIESVFAPNPMQARMCQRLEFEILTAGGKAGGKASCLSSKVLTPYGFKEMRHIKVDTKVCNPDGTHANVIAVHPQGVQPIFKIKFTDGSATRTTAEHLWVTRWNAQKWIGRERFEGDQGWRISTTEMMKKRLDSHRANAKLNNFTWQIPLTKPVEFLNVSELPLSPYALGVLLGDAHIGEKTVRLTNPDQQIIDEVEKAIGCRLSQQPSKDISYHVPQKSGVFYSLRAMGLTGKRAWEKFVPQEYLHQTIENRWFLLQGLMDTDGYADSRGHCSYCSTSKQLAEDVQFIVRSLGGRASITSKPSHYTKDGERVECRIAYNVWITFVDGSKLFRLQRKLDRCTSRPDNAWVSAVKNIESIDPDGEDEAQCITVDNPNGLYICDDFTVTHNSFGAIFWMVKGNPEKPDYDENGKPILVNMSYVHHPRFLGAVIRLNEKDLADWVDQARPFYEGVLGGTFTKNPAEFRWPSGARIFLGHAQDSNAWTKYAGQNITRFFIDEAGQIRDMQTYDIIRSCCRSLVPELRAQILLTANPDGPGMQWLFDRFIEPKTSNGVPIKHPLHDRPIVDSDGGLIELIETGENPFTHEKVTRNRVWVPSYITDNPHAMASPDYIATLATMQDPKMRRAYLLGDWKALRGTYFDIFRRETHTYDPLVRPLASWWKASASLDWGFVHESAAYWHKQDPETKQHLIYKEFVTNRTDPIELGAELARQSMAELRVQGSITFHVSHDLYHERIGEFSWIELIGKGVQRVLGEGTCYIPEVVMKRLRDSYQIEGKEWDEGIEERILGKQISGIVFRRAPKARAVGFMYMRSLMRMEPLIAVKDEKPDWDIALRLSQEGSVADYATYLKSFKREMEILPQLLISQSCPRLIDAIPKAIHSTDDPNDIDKGHFLGNDSCESVRYLLTGIRDDKPTATPRMLDRERQLSEARRRNPELTTADLIWISRGIEQREAESDEAQDGFCLGRSSRGSRYRVVDDVL